MKEKVENFLKEKEELISELKEWVKNKSIPLEERWEIFIKSKLGLQKSYYWDFKSFNKDKNDFHADRDKYRVYDVNDVVDYYENESDEDKLATEDEINEFKEEALENFIFSWEFDW